MFAELPGIWGSNQWPADQLQWPAKGGYITLGPITYCLGGGGIGGGTESASPNTSTDIKTLVINILTVVSNSRIADLGRASSVIASRGEEIASLAIGGMDIASLRDWIKLGLAAKIVCWVPGLAANMRFP